jgi:N-acetylglucosamine malate deacetylase 1
VNVLVVAPHPDDESIGCGGTIALHTSNGDHVEVVFLTSGELGLKHLPVTEARSIREAEAQAAATILGVAKLHFLRQPDWMLNDHIDQAAPELANILAKVRPDVIYAPHPGEDHPDHRVALEVLQTALSRLPRVGVQIYGYEIWTPVATYDHVVDISALMETKLSAIRSYVSQLKAFRYDEAIAGLNQYRGALAGHCRFAEVFKSDAFPPG